MYVMAYNKRLDFAQLFFDQLFAYVVANNKPTYVHCPRWIELILACTREGNNVNHGVSIPVPILSSKIVNVVPTDGDMHLSQSMEN